MFLLLCAKGQRTINTFVEIFLAEAEATPQNMLLDI
jgi:hypothetical protein